MEEVLITASAVAMWWIIIRLIKRWAKKEVLKELAKDKHSGSDTYPVFDIVFKADTLTSPISICENIRHEQASKTLERLHSIFRLILGDTSASFDKEGDLFWGQTKNNIGYSVSIKGSESPKEKDAEKTRTNLSFDPNLDGRSQKAWFYNTSPWSEINRNLIDEVLTAFGNNPLLEVFVHTSTFTGLTAAYKRLGDTEYTKGLGHSQVSHILCNAGCEAVDVAGQMAQEDKTKQAQFASMMSLTADATECALALDANQLTAYLVMAKHSMILQKPERVIEWADKGLKKLGEKRSFLQKSALPQIATDLDSLEAGLKMMREWGEEFR